MENKKEFCPNCGSQMIVEYEKPALNFSCPKCGLKIATTRWEEIDLDQKTYLISVVPGENPSFEQIKFISKITGKNYIECKGILTNGGEIYKGFAIDVLKRKKELAINKISFSIDPFFKY